MARINMGADFCKKIIILLSIRYWARVIVSLTSLIVFGPSFPSSFFIASKTNCSLFCRNFFSSSHNSTLYRISVGAVLRTRTFSFHVLRCYSVARRVLSFFSSVRQLHGIQYRLHRRIANMVNSPSMLRELMVVVQNVM